MKRTDKEAVRRKLLLAMASSGLLSGFGALLPAYANAQGNNRRSLTETAARIPGGEPRSVTMDVHIRRETIDIAGGAASAITVNGTVPGPMVELWEGHNALLRVHNHLDESTSIHWHGILLPFQMDGVPGIVFPGIAPGETFEVHFPVRQYGTYWYHSHTGIQEQIGQTGPIVIHPAKPDPVPSDREYVIVLNDWTFEDPHRLVAKLKKMSDYYNFNRRTVADLFEDMSQDGWDATLRDRLAWGNMRMSPRDIADVTSYTYSHLMNGMHPEANWTGLFQPGEKVRLRVINASSMTYYNFRIPGLAMTVIAADGQNVEPVETDEFQVGVAETYDVVVTPEAGVAYTLMAETMDRSGFARGTLAPAAGMEAAVPALRARPQRTMIDMGMDMSSMGMGDMNMGSMEMNDMNMGSPGPMSQGGGQEAGNSHAMPMGADNASNDGVPAMPGNHDHAAMAGTEESASMPAMDMGGTGTMMDASGPVVATHGPDGHGAGNLNVAGQQRYRLADKPTGLDGVNHRVLTYSQLRNVKPMEDTRPPSQTVELHLTGNMERYMWSFDGVKYTSSTPIEFNYGERIRLILVNDTMMEHPIHLHGMFMELENEQGDRLPFKHTISVLPGSRVSLLVTANEPGRWAFHCHFLYHMEMGMFRVVRIVDREGAVDVS